MTVSNMMAIEVDTCNGRYVSGGSFQRSTSEQYSLRERLDFSLWEMYIATASTYP